MLKVRVIFSRQWEFIKGFLTEEGHDQICISEGQCVGRTENQYRKQGEQLGAGAVIQVRNYNGVSPGSDSEERGMRTQLNIRI